MVNHDWKPFLDRWSKAILQSENLGYFKLPKAAIQSGWLGYPCAEEAQIVAVETRLGKTLPPSYRTFLKLTNGWRATGNFIGDIWPVDRIDWLAKLNPDQIVTDNYMEMDDPPWMDHGSYRLSEVERFSQIAGTLQISDWGDEELFLLNPEAVGTDGEWEAWFMAGWIPGAYRFPSFWDMLQHEYHTLLNKQVHDNKRAKTDDEISARLPHLLQELRTRAAMYPQANDPSGAVYGDGVRAGYAEAQQRIQQLQEANLQPIELRMELLRLADEFEQHNREFPTGVGNLASMLFDTHKMTDKIRDGGKAESYRQAASTIRWFLGEN